MRDDARYSVVLPRVIYFLAAVFVGLLASPFLPKLCHGQTLGWWEQGGDALRCLAKINGQCSMASRTLHGREVIQFGGGNAQRVAHSLGEAERLAVEGECGVGVRSVLSTRCAAVPQPAGLREFRPLVGRQRGRDSSGVFHAPNIALSVPKYNIALPLGATLLGYLGGTIDHDAGGYRDSFKFQPDKQAHLLASVVLSKAVADGTSVKLGALTCLLAGAAWEAGQARHHGFASRYDMAYDAGGCLAGAIWGRK